MSLRQARQKSRREGKAEEQKRRQGRREDLHTADFTVPFDHQRFEAQTTISKENQDSQALKLCNSLTCRRDFLQIAQPSNPGKTNHTDKHVHLEY